MKLHHERAVLIEIHVAPHAGAWVETSSTARNTACPLVAPHAGAWVETMPSPVAKVSSGVAPHAGAWVETPGDKTEEFKASSPPTRGRGLKHEFCKGLRSGHRRPPRGGVG